MKRFMAVLLVMCMILVTPAYAAAISSGDQNFDPMDIKAKGVDVGAVNELINENKAENSSNEMSNITGTLYTDDELSKANITENTMENTTNTENSSNEENSTETSTEQLDTKNDSDIENSKPEVANETITAPVLNTTGIVMQTTNYTCGPAALATVLNNMGINATEQELAILAGTDENGTTMYGLIAAAKSKGLNAKGTKVALNNLKKNYIVFLTIKGSTHYSVIKEITNDTVFIADPSLGNIAMTLEEFNNDYSGYALIITEFKGTNVTNELDNFTENNFIENIALNDIELQNIKGMKHLEWVNGYWSWKPGYWSWQPGYWSWVSGYSYWHSGYFYWVNGYWAKWWIFWYWVPGYWAWHSGWWAYQPGYRHWNPGYWKWNQGYWIWHDGFWKEVYDYNWQNEATIAWGVIEVGGGIFAGATISGGSGGSATAAGIIVAGIGVGNGLRDINSAWNNQVWV